MSTLDHIRIALENHLSTATGMPDVAWPNVPYTPTPGTAYLRPRFVPVARRPRSVGPAPEQRHAGLFNINIYTPEGRGAAAGIALADALMARFDVTSPIVTSDCVVRIDWSETKRPLHEPPFYVIPVEISWHSYVS